MIAANATTEGVSLAVRKKKTDDSLFRVALRVCAISVPIRSFDRRN